MPEVPFSLNAFSSIWQFSSHKQRLACGLRSMAWTSATRVIAAPFRQNETRIMNVAQYISVALDISFRAQVAKEVPAV